VDSPNQFWMRLVLVFVGIIAMVIVGRELMLPESWGEYGYYRGDMIDEEAHRDIKYGTNESCAECHSNVSSLKAHSNHATLSCEICHAPVSVHAKDNKKFADMPIKKGEDQVQLCLKCHQKTVGRPDNFPMIDRYEHLDERGVKATHTCDQCHTVHAPLENINHVKQQRDLKEALDAK